MSSISEATFRGNFDASFTATEPERLPGRQGPVCPVLYGCPEYQPYLKEKIFAETSMCGQRLTAALLAAHDLAASTQAANALHSAGLTRTHESVEGADYIPYQVQEPSKFDSVLNGVGVSKSYSTESGT
jgi:hypothetical protein